MPKFITWDSDSESIADAITKAFAEMGQAIHIAAIETGSGEMMAFALDSEPFDAAEAQAQFNRDNFGS